MTAPRVPASGRRQTADGDRHRMLVSGGRTALSFVTPEDELQNSIGRYQIIEKVGQGGMGVVYRAYDTLLEREVALKIISASIEGNPELRERFFREARAAGQLSHRNIITIHDLGEHEGQPYLAMEFLTGEDLQHRLSRPEPMSLTRKLEIAAEICEGLSYAHRRGLIHRDIKPANIFITDEGVVKILDFGLARMVTSELTASNMMLGTLNYMAPEQVRGERTDHRSDIFSFGVVLYEILSGRKAFQGDSFATTLYKILQDVPEPLQNIDASLPHEVVRLVEKAIAKGKDERYQDLSEVARDLALHRQHLAVSDSDTMEIQVPSAFRSPPGRLPSDPPGATRLPRPDSGQRPKSGPKSGPKSTLEPPAQTIPSDATTTISPGSLPHPRSKLPMIAAVAAIVVLLLGVGWLSRRDRSAPDQATVPPAGSLPAPPASTPAAPQNPPAPPAGAPTTSSSAQPEAREAPPAQTDAQAVDDARNRMARAKAAARRVGSIAERSAAFAEALAAEREGVRLHGAKRLSEAAAKFYEAAGLFRSAELTQAAARPSEAAPSGQAPQEPVRPPSTSPAAPSAPAPVQTAPPPGQSSPPTGQSSPPPLTPPAETPVQLPPAAVPGPPIPSVTRNPPSTAVPPASPRALEEEVRELLRRYEQALEARNIDALKRIWPTLQGTQETAVRDDFAHARRIDVDIENVDVSVSGATAIVTFVRRYQVFTTDGQRLLTSNRTTMNARRAGTDWLIERVRFEALR